MKLYSKLLLACLVCSVLARVENEKADLQKRISSLFGEENINMGIQKTLLRRKLNRKKNIAIVNKAPVKHKSATGKFVDSGIEWDNFPDKILNKECNANNGEAMFRVRSKYSGWTRDRTWRFDCKKVSKIPMTQCSWTQYVNFNGGQPIDIKCPQNFALTGIHSVHFNSKEDRRWKIKCCQAPGYITQGCKKTKKLNKVKERLDHRVPSSKIGGKGMLTGLYSAVHIKHVDRSWQMYECKYKANKQPVQAPAAPVMTRHYYFMPYDMYSDFVNYVPMWNNQYPYSD